MTESMTKPSVRRWLAEVTVVPKIGVNDPQGEAIRGGLHAMGYQAVRSVRAGKVIRLEIEAANADGAEGMAREMCDRLLANPVIESFSVTVAALDDQ